MSEGARQGAGRGRVFLVVMAGCAQFAVLTLLAMLLYPGGTIGDPGTKGYSFFHNFFSDLGRTRTVSGEPNAPSMVLFMVALTLAGLGLVLFFAASLRFFAGRRAARILSWVGLCCGAVSGAGFVGVAFAPYDLWLRAHGWFVLLAFQAFLPAALAFAAAIFLTRGYPRGFAWLYLAFAALLAAYVALLRAGPSLQEGQGLVIQAAGQKGIVYAAIGTVFVQAWGARRLAGRS